MHSGRMSMAVVQSVWVYQRLLVFYTYCTSLFCVLCLSPPILHSFFWPYCIASVHRACFVCASCVAGRQYSRIVQINKPQEYTFCDNFIKVRSPTTGGDSRLRKIFESLRSRTKFGIPLFVNMSPSVEFPSSPGLFYERQRSTCSAPLILSCTIPPHPSKSVAAFSPPIPPPWSLSCRPRNMRCGRSCPSSWRWSSTLERRSPTSTSSSSAPCRCAVVVVFCLEAGCNSCFRCCRWWQCRW